MLSSVVFSDFKYDFKRKHSIVEFLVLNDDTYLKASHFEYSSYAAHKDPWIGNIQLVHAERLPPMVDPLGSTGPVLEMDRVFW